MTTLLQSKINQLATLDHELKQYFPELRRFESTLEMEASTLFKQINPEVDRILNAVVQENFADDVSFSNPQ